MSAKAASTKMIKNLMATLNLLLYGLGPSNARRIIAPLPTTKGLSGFESLKTDIQFQVLLLSVPLWGSEAFKLRQTPSLTTACKQVNGIVLPERALSSTKANVGLHICFPRVHNSNDYLATLGRHIDLDFNVAKLKRVGRSPTVSPSS